jgi:hypothetical protein
LLGYDVYDVQKKTKSDEFIAYCDKLMYEHKYSLRPAASVCSVLPRVATSFAAGIKPLFELHFFSREGLCRVWLRE